MGTPKLNCKAGRPNTMHYVAVRFVEKGGSRLLVDYLLSEIG